MSELPERWIHGVRADGRVFFISDAAQTTTWLHPRTGLPVNSGHMVRSDLPRGWEEDFTPDGASYFIDHNERRTTFTHPQTGLCADHNFILRELVPQSRAMSKPELSTSGAASVALGSKTTRGAKVHNFGKRQLSVRRNLNVSVQRRGWLCKQDGRGMRLWKRKWFVLSDFCLFYYKDSREQTVLGSIPLPSYEVSPVGADDHISRKFTFKARPPHQRRAGIGPLKRSSSVIGRFKRSSSPVIGRQAQHPGMRTYFFSAETQDDMNAWITAMNRAARVQDGDTRPEGHNGVHRVHNGVHCGTNTSTDTRRHEALELLDSSLSSEQTLVHEVQLEPLHRVQKSPVAAVTTHLTPPPPDPAPSQSRFNDLDQSPILEPNGIAAGTYQTSPAPDTPPGSVYRPATPTARQTTPTGSTYRQATPTPRQATPTGRQATPPNIRDQVQNWVKVQREEQRRSASRNSLHRVTPPTQFSPIEPPPHHHTAPSGRAGEYRYAQDRLSHLGLSDSASAAPPQVWRLYEWQQRHRYRHGNPTAPLYSPAPLQPYGPRPIAAGDRAPTPRCIEVPPSASEVPPSLLSRPIGRRPHTPAERLTVRPTNEGAVRGGTFTASPRRSQSQFFKTSTLDRRSLPVSGHMTHTISAPSLHGKTPEELTLLLIQLRRQQSKMAAIKRDFLCASPAPRVSPGPCSAQVDESYQRLKKDLEFLDLKIRALQPLISAVHSLLLHCTAGPLGPPGPPVQAGGAVTLKESKAVRAADSDVDVKLSRLCEQDKALKELQETISALSEDKDQLESVLALCHQQMEQSSDPDALQKVSLHQKLLQEDLVHLRAQLSRAFTDMCRSWEQYLLLETSVEQLRSALQNQLDQLDLISTAQLQRSDLKRELWRIEDVLSGLSSSRSSYSSSVQLLINTERTLEPSAPPPRPPLPCGFDEDEDSAPEVPPLPREAAAIRHTSVRGLKRQSDERRRDREGGDWKFQTDLRSFLSEPELPVDSSSCAHLDSAPSGLKQSSVSAFVTLRRGAGDLVRGAGDRERPKSAFECSASSPSALDSDWLSSVQSRGRMSADEQLRRMRRHRSGVGQSDHGSSQEQLLLFESLKPEGAAALDTARRGRCMAVINQTKERPITEGQSGEGRGQSEAVQSEQRTRRLGVTEVDLEPQEFSLDLSRELSRPEKVRIPERLEPEPEELSSEELQQRRERAERIRTRLQKSGFSVMALMDVSELNSALLQKQKVLEQQKILEQKVLEQQKILEQKVLEEQKVRGASQRV